MAKEFPDDATSAAVIGCGPVGLMAILAAQAQGAEKVGPKPCCRSPTSTCHVPAHLLLFLSLCYFGYSADC